MSLTPEQKYSAQKASAKIRGIDWQLSFNDWYDWWQQTGHWEERGCRKGQYVMSRIGDCGPYSLNNIFCSTVEQNNSDRHKFNPYVSQIMKQTKIKTTMTPAGLFPSKRDAAKHYRVHSTTISKWMTSKSKEFYYVIS